MNQNFSEDYKPPSASSFAALADFPFKKSGKNVRFFNDHVEFNGKSIRYDDVAVLSTHASTTIHTYFLIPVARSFGGSVTFETKDGKKHNMLMNAMNFFGIGSARKAEELYPPVFGAVYEIVAKNMVQKFIHAINSGATVEVSDFTINKNEAISKKTLLRKSATVNKENYGGCGFLQGYSLCVRDKFQENLYISALNAKNALLIPYIFDAIFLPNTPQ